MQSIYGRWFVALGDPQFFSKNGLTKLCAPAYRESGEWLHITVGSLCPQTNGRA
jgi:hypothetical protein